MLSLPFWRAGLSSHSVESEDIGSGAWGLLACSERVGRDTDNDASIIGVGTTFTRPRTTGRYGM